MATRQAPSWLSLSACSLSPKGDDDRAQDLCMGTKRKYDWKLEAGMGVYGVNCDGDSEVEGDVFWTMPPDYRLSY